MKQPVHVYIIPGAIIYGGKVVYMHRSVWLFLLTTTLYIGSTVHFIYECTLHFLHAWIMANFWQQDYKQHHDNCILDPEPKCFTLRNVLLNLLQHLQAEASEESKPIITTVAKGVAYGGDHMPKNSWPLKHSQTDVSMEPETVVVIAAVIIVVTVVVIVTSELWQ